MVEARTGADELPEAARRDSEPGPDGQTLVQAPAPVLPVDDGSLPTTVPAPQTASVTAELPLSRLGRFELGRELGRGAFGVVFLAHDPRLNRSVALKVPRSEVLLTPELRTRFQQEARAAAALDHPNIVPVYEAGEENATCYIAHAYCAGTTLAAWLKKQTEAVPYPLAARLCMKLAEAVQHAHERGVLHRDLKPSNVLLEEAGRETAAAPADSDPLPFVPRVTDFGLAKLVGGDFSTQEFPGATLSGAILGTPSYMAPEQADGRSRTAGPAADVYALGAILYEILTGRPPLQADTPLQTLMLVRDTEPLPPSRLRPGLPRDLETICLHCLAKDPSRRYRSGADLAADLQRFLAGEPIRARPASAWERALKWARRRPVLATFAAVSAAAVLSVLVVVLSGNARLQQQRDLAEDRRRDTERQRHRAVVHLREARAAVDRMLTRVGYERLESVPYMETVRRELLEEALQFYQGFVREEADDPGLLLETARAWRRLGNIQGLLGDQKAAEQSYRQALALATRLHASFPEQAEYRSERAACLENLAGVLLATNLGEGAELIRPSLEMHEQLAEEFPRVVEYRAEWAVASHTHGRLLQAAGKTREAEAAFRRTVRLLEQVVADAPSRSDLERSLAVHRRDLGVFLARQKRLTEAEPLFRIDLDFWEKQAAQAPTVPRYQARAGDAAFHLGNLLTATGQRREGEQLLRRAVERRQRLVDEFPKVLGYHADLRAAQEIVARMLRARGDCTAAIPFLKGAVLHQRIVLQADPGNNREAGLLSSYCWLLADSQLQLGQYRDPARLAEELPTFRAKSWQECYQAARLLTRCITLVKADAQLDTTARSALVEHHSMRAVAWLREAFRRGCKEQAFLKKDPGLNVLRTRADFKQLLRDLTGT